MSDFIKNVMGGQKADEPAVAQQDSDFADFAGAPEPVPEPVPAAAPLSPPSPGSTAVPWTAWYNVHERHSLSEFQAEGWILAIAGIVLVFHVIGARINRSKARSWIRGYAPILRSEYAVVGFGGVPTMDNSSVTDESLLKEKSLFEFATYCTGRANTAFTDVKITLNKRFNPLMHWSETMFSIFFDSVPSPYDYLEAFTYPFDGKEALTVPSPPGAAEARAKDKSSYDGFVWALVNKSVMQKARDERYDLSLTTTRDHPKLPNWLSVMTESAEITDVMLSQELIDAVTAAGDSFEYLIVTDQPTEKPTSLAETTPRKRLILKHRLPSGSGPTAYDALLPIFSYFVRLTDFLAQNAHFRPEAMKKVRATRDAMIAQLKKALDEKESEERAAEREKAKKLKREADLKGLDAKAQKKYLDKESAKEQRKAQKKQTVRG